MKKTLSDYLAPRDNNPSNYKAFEYLPKKIFQTSGTHEVSEGMYHAVQTWINKNPDWEYYFFDNQACDRFVKEHFSINVLEAYEALLPGAYKADLWRYCVLYVHGGVYCDIKQELVIGLNDIIPGDVEFLSIKDNDKKSEFSSNIYQAFICAKPKHPFLQKVIEVIVDHVQTGYYGYDALSPTGPAALGKAIKLVLNKPSNHSLSPGVHHELGCQYVLWPIGVNRQRFTGDGRHFINISYSEHGEERSEQEIKSGTLKYARAWYFNKVYTHGKVYRPKSSRYNRKIKSERAKWVRDLYRYGERRKARQEMFNCICKRQLSFRLFVEIFYYELVYPCVSLLMFKK